MQLPFGKGGFVELFLWHTAFVSSSSSLYVHNLVLTRLRQTRSIFGE